MPSWSLRTRCNVPRFFPASHPSSPPTSPSQSWANPRGRHLLGHFPEAFQRLRFRGVELGIVSGGVLYVAFLDHPNTQETPAMRRKSERCPVRLRFPSVGRANGLASPSRGWGHRSIMNVAHGWQL